MPTKSNKLADFAREQGATDVTTEQPKRLSDLRPRQRDTILIDGLVGQDVTVKSFEELDSQFGEAGTKYMVLCVDTPNGHDVFVRCGAAALMKRVRETADLMPYIATVKRLGNSYTLE